MVKENIEEEKVSISKKDFADIQNFIKSNAEKEAEKDKKIEELTAKINSLSSKTMEEVEELDKTIEQGTKGTLRKTQDGKFVIGWVKKPNGRAIYSERNPANQTEMLQFIDLVVLGKDKPMKTLYKTFIEDFATEEITFSAVRNQPAEIISDGLRDQMFFDTKTGQMESTGRKVKAVIINDAKVKVVVNLNGQDIEIDESFINA